MERTASRTRSVVGRVSEFGTIILFPLAFPDIILTKQDYEVTTTGLSI